MTRNQLVNQQCRISKTYEGGPQTTASRKRRGGRPQEKNWCPSEKSYAPPLVKSWLLACSYISHKSDGGEPAAVQANNRKIVKQGELPIPRWTLPEWSIPP